MRFISQMIAKTGIAVPAQASLVREIYRKYGTPGLTVYSAMVGDMPIKKWDGVGITVDMEGLMKEFYDTVGWDLNTGGPTPSKIKELGIEGLCD